MSTTDVGFVDKGGIQYRIDVQGNGQEKLDAFRASLTKTRRSFRAFRSDIRSLNTDARQVARGIDRLTTASESLEKQRAKSATTARTQLRVTREQGREAGRQTRNIRQQSTEVKKLTQFQKERIRLQRQLSRFSSTREQSRELAVLRRRLTVLNQVAKAEQKLATIRSLASQGRDINTGELFAEQQKRLLLESQNDLKREQATLSNTALRASRAELSATQQIVKAEQQLANQQALRAQGRLQTGLTPEQTAFRNLNRELDNLKLQETEKRLGKTNAQFKEMQRQVNLTRRGLGQAEGGLRRFGARLRQTENRANRISFTFRRLIGIFAAFQALRIGADIFSGAIRGGVEFNALIERAELGIASLFTAVGEVRDPFGNLVSASQQLVQAQSEARRQTQLLRRDSLQTLATFEQLVDTFQIAVAPGFTAGLDIDEIRKLSVSISQAAGAIGLPQNQLAEEIRSLLAGTIQARTTRIATSLGITNEDIRRAKELGVLSEFLEERFSAFGVAGEQALNTIDGLVARVRDSLSQLAGGGGIEFFNELKDLLRDVIDLVSQQDEEGIVEPSPEALIVVNALLSGLQEAVQVGRELASALTLDEVLSVAQGLGSLIGVIANVLSTVFVGVTRGAATLGNLFQNLAEQFSAIGDFFSDSDVSNFLSELIEVAVVILGIQVSFGLIFSIAGLLLSPINLLLRPLRIISTLLIGMGVSLRTQILGPLRAIRTVVFSIFSPVGLIVVALVAIVAITKNWLDDLTGVELKFTSFVKILGTSLIGSFKVAIATIQLGFVQLFGFLRIGFRNVIQGVQELAGGFLDLVLQAASVFSDAAEKARKDLETARDSDRGKFKKQLEEDAAEILKAEQALRDARTAVAEQTGENINKILEDNADADSILEALGIQGAIDSLGDLFDGADFNFDDADESAQGLVAQLDQLPAIIGRGTKEVTDLSASLKKLDDELRRSQGQLNIALGTSGIDNNILNVRKELLQAEVDLREQGRKIEEERSQLLQAEIAQQAELNRQIQAEMDSGISDETALGVVLARRRNELLRDTTALEELINATQEARVKAQREGDDEKTAAFTEQLTLLQQQRQEVDRLLDSQNNALGGFAAGAVGDDAEAQAELEAAILARINLEAQSISNNERLVNLSEQALLLEESRNELAQTRIATIAAGDLQNAEDRARLLAAELQAEQTIAETRSRFGNQTAAREFARSQARVNLEQTRFNLEIEALERSRVAAAENTAELERQVTLANTRLEQVQQLAADGLASAQDITAAQDTLAVAEQARIAVQQLQTLELQAQSLELEKQGVALDTLRQKTAEFKQDQIDSPISAGLTAGLDDFITQAEDTFNNFRDIASSAISDISGALADEIINAIDPNSNADFGERLNAVFQGIAKQLLQQSIEEGAAGLLGGLIEEEGPEAAKTASEQAVLVQREAIIAAETGLVASQATAFAVFGTATTSLVGAMPPFTGAAGTLASAMSAMTIVTPTLLTTANTMLAAAIQLEIAAIQLLAANLAGSTGGGGGGGVGGFEGGHILTRGPASPAHFNRGIRGLAQGGSTSGPRYRPPAGVDRRDNIPMWASIGEFMQPANSVRKYGTQVMESIRRGLIDPSALKALAGAGSRTRLRVAQPKVGFQTGGAVTQDTTDQSIQQLDGDQDFGNGGGSPLVSIIGEDEADTIFSQGTNAMLELMAQEQSKFRSALGF